MNGSGRTTPPVAAACSPPPPASRARTTSAGNGSWSAASPCAGSTATPDRARSPRTRSTTTRAPGLRTASDVAGRRRGENRSANPRASRARLYWAFVFARRPPDATHPVLQVLPRRRAHHDRRDAGLARERRAPAAPAARCPERRGGGQHALLARAGRRQELRRAHVAADALQPRAARSHDRFLVAHVAQRGRDAGGDPRRELAAPAAARAQDRLTGV